MTSEDRLSELREAGALQARICRDGQSPTYATLLEALAAGIANDHVAARLLLSDGRDPVVSALYLRFLGAVNRLAVLDDSCPLRSFYPTLGGRVDLDEVVPCFLQVVAGNEDFVGTEMKYDVQTNDVGRAVLLSAAMNHVAATPGTALRLLEVGASAGLNLWLDRYRIRARERSWGPADSLVQLEGDFVAGSPPDTGFVVSERHGCDLNPLDISKQSIQVLLKSFIWPENTVAIRRLEAALATVPSAAPAPIDHAEAGGWVRDKLADLAPGVTTVVYHSFVLPYFTDTELREFETTIRDAGERADDDHRLAWVSLEPIASEGVAHLSCERWPERERTTLATCTTDISDITWHDASSR